MSEPYWTIGRYYFALSLIFCTLLTCAGLPRRSKLALRLSLGTLAIACVVTAYVLADAFAGPLPTWVGYSFYFVVYVSVIWLTLLCFPFDLWTALFCATVGYCIEHLAERSFELVRSAMPSDTHFLLLYLVRTALLVAVCFVIWLLVVRGGARTGGRVLVDKRLQSIAAVVIVFVLVFLSLMAIESTHGNDSAANYVYALTAMFAFVGILFEYSMCAGKRSEAELAVIRRILREERERYDREKLNIETINIKCHDLRHQLAAYKEKLEKEELQSIYDAIGVYDSGISTGCDALDVVINAKMPMCVKDGIRLTCLVDGRKLRAYPEHEIYSLFGNALENAMCAVWDLPPEKRIISVTEKGDSGFANIRVENYYEGELKFAEGLPVTTKIGEGHGYGVKSMRYIAEKHGGALRAIAEEDVFRLEILLPVLDDER